MKTLLHNLLLGGILICYVFLGIVAYWMLYPYQVIKYQITPLPILNKEVKAGDTLQVRLKFCKYMDIPVHGVITIEDNVILTLPDFDSNTRVGCYDRVNLVSVPSIMVASDSARLHYTLTFHVNPIRNITYELYSEEFHVK